MVKSKEASKMQECKEKTMKDNKKNKVGGYKEPRDPLTNKGRRHSAAALKKDTDAISNEVAVVPIPIGENKEETIAQEAAVAGFEKKVDDVEIPDKDKEQIGESITLRFEDSEKFINAISEFDNNLPYDFDENSFIVGVSKEKVDAFREFMSEKGIEEMPYFNETEKKIAEVQSKRSNRALELDNSKKAIKIGIPLDEEHLSRWLQNPQLSDIIGVDDGEK
ncbi:MAG: hypothetical protein A2W22_01925 [Candidatus Levybacteria bacterium RBG_16_35_11]|nr:MAG: hypothetical protein A2W22_01925 [Candidatus Levybacteria bacterium RBG_16_35_11]